jgi:HSP20 family molecular chaperone IbpA
MVVSRELTQDDATIELRNTSDRLWISTDFPDRSLDEIRVSVRGASLRIRAGPSDESPRRNGIDRTITLARAVNPADVVVAYDDPTLAIIVPYDDR